MNEDMDVDVCSVEFVAFGPTVYLRIKETPWGDGPLWYEMVGNEARLEGEAGSDQLEWYYREGGR